MEIERRKQLIELLRHFNLPLIAVELGVLGGAFSDELIRSGIEKVYSVDMWRYMPVFGDGGSDQNTHDTNYNSTVELLSKHGDKSVIIKGFTHEVAEQFSDNTFGLIYHDASHDLIPVTRDIDVWYPKLVDGGIFAFHDFENEAGVNSAVTHFCSQREIQMHSIPENNYGDAGVWFQKPIK